MGSECLYTLFLFREVYLYTSSSDLLVTNLPVMFFPSSCLYCQTLNHIPGTRGDLYLWPSPLSGKINKTCALLGSALQQAFPSPLFFRVILEPGCSAIAVFSGGTSIPRKTICKPNRKFFLPQPTGQRELLMRPSMIHGRKKIMPCKSLATYPHATYLCLQGLLEPTLIYTTSI